MSISLYSPNINEELAVPLPFFFLASLLSNPRYEDLEPQMNLNLKESHLNIFAVTMVLGSVYMLIME